MNDFEQIFEWLKECPELYNLWVISSLLKDDKNILQPNSTSNMYNVNCEKYVDNRKKISFIPVEPYYFDIDIICYRSLYGDENQDNIEVQKKLQSVCDWLIEQQNTDNTPYEECYQVECLNPKPFIRGAYQDNDSNTVLVDYAVTVRFYTDNPAKKKVVVR